MCQFGSARRPRSRNWVLLNVSFTTCLTATVTPTPQNTLGAIDSVIDPLLNGPGEGLPVAATGTRYLILNDIGNVDNVIPAAAWGPVVAKANDIIEFDGTYWVVAFEAATGVNVQYATNITTGLQYRWEGSENGAQWVKSYEGLYPGGEWSLVL
jgi:hypothetical protein